MSDLRSRRLSHRHSAARRSSGIRGRLLLSAGVLASIAFATSASAQVETVTVTAQRVEQNIQQVPVAVTAFTASELQSQHITSMSQLQSLTPNVNFDGGAPFSGDSSTLSASIRGIGQDDFAFNIEPGVGVYLDGVYIARTIGANVDLLDVQRVEVLKGPQGTLFGRNTIGGAINIVTRNPGDAYTLEVQATTGSLNRRDIAATADIPISDTLHTSITFSSAERDGYQEVVPYHNVNNYTVRSLSAIRLGARTNDHLAARTTRRRASRPCGLRGYVQPPRWPRTGRIRIRKRSRIRCCRPSRTRRVAATSIAALYTACLEGAQWRAGSGRTQFRQSLQPAPRHELAAHVARPAAAAQQQSAADSSRKRRRPATSTRPMPTAPTTRSTTSKA